MDADVNRAAPRRSAPAPAPAAPGHAARVAGAGPGAAAAWRSGAGWVTVGVVTLLSIAADLASKSIAFATVMSAPVVVDRQSVLRIGAVDPRRVNELIPAHEPVVVVPGLLEFTLVLNPGAVFGIGPGQRWFFIAFTVVALAFGLLMFARWTTARDRFAHAAIGLLIGGGLGNLYDRLVYGCVRDFIHPLPGWKWPGGITIRGNAAIWPYVSNVADLLLLIGIGMLMIHLWRRDRLAARAPGRAAPRE